MEFRCQWPGPPIRCHFCSICKEFSVRTEDEVLRHEAEHLSKSLDTSAPPMKVRRITGKAHICPYENCTITFKCQSHLERHVRIHTGERPFSCERCNKSFKRQSHLRRHELTHLGHRSYACTECPRAFACIESLRKHARLHLEKSDGDRNRFVEEMTKEGSSCSYEDFLPDRTEQMTLRSLDTYPGKDKNQI